jgi:hypothetical protein
MHPFGANTPSPNHRVSMMCNNGHFAGQSILVSRRGWVCSVSPFHVGRYVQFTYCREVVEFPRIECWRGTMAFCGSHDWR